MIKLVAVDMDGTFLDDQMHYNRTIFRKIYNYFKENDIYFVVASGNQYYQLKTTFEKPWSVSSSDSEQQKDNQ